MAVTLTERGLDIDGKTVPVYSGSVHYWRLERDLWPLILDRAQSLGFGMIETYIPWSVHETAPNEFDWGTTDSRKDFEAFCQLCEARGLYLMVRPGPLINAEMSDFGFPEWVLLDPDVQAQTAVGSLHLDAAWGFHPPRPFPVPSYASPKFYDAVGRWFDAACPIITRHLAPRGCIVAVQSDNETCYLFHDEVYATDYSAASIDAYQEFLRQRYETIEDLNASYRRTHQDFDSIDPPRDCQIQTAADVPWHRDWVEYKERYIHNSVVEIAQMLRERGVQGVPIFHNVAYQYRTPIDIARMESSEAIDWVGINLYRTPQDYTGVTKRMRYLSGTTKLPFVPEFGSGIWSHHPRTPTPAEQEFVTLAALMHGMRAVNFYMLVERERWQGSPITRNGAYRPEYADFYYRLSAFLRQYPLGALSPQKDVIVLLNYDLGRYEAMASTLHYAHVDLLRLPDKLKMVDLDLGFRWDVAQEADHDRPDNWLGRVMSQLQELHVDYDLADTHLNLQRLRRYPIACVPTVDFLDAADQRLLLDYVAAGGRLIFGPGLPYLDSDLRPASILSEVAQTPGETLFGQGYINWVSADAIARVLTQYVQAPTVRWDNSHVEVVEHCGEMQRLLFVANPTEYAQKATIAFNERRRLSPVWGGQAPPVLGAQVSVVLAPYTVQIWEASVD